MNQTTFPNSILVPVTIDNGMFSNEFSCMLKLANGTMVSFFADKTLFEERGGQWFIKTSFIDNIGHNKLVLLPVEPIETATRWVEVEGMAA
jgi:hypothetical protein